MTSAATRGGLRIGEVAVRADVSTRTLRYYEELGLLPTAKRTAGGARRYSEGDVAALLRIRELQELMGFDLEEIRTIVDAESRLAQLRTEYRAGVRPKRQEQLLREAVRINDELRAAVRAKLGRIQRFAAGLESKATRYRELLDEIDAGATAEDGASRR